MYVPRLFYNELGSPTFELEKENTWRLKGHRSFVRKNTITWNINHSKIFSWSKCWNFTQRISLESRGQDIFLWTDNLSPKFAYTFISYFHIPHTTVKRWTKFSLTGLAVSSNVHDANPTPTFPAWLLAVHWLWSQRDKAALCTVPPLSKQRLEDKRAALQYVADHHLLSSASHLLFHGCKVSTSKMLIWREEKHPVSLANFLST